MNENYYIEDIKEALQNVSGKFIISSNGNTYLAERIFAYEFYHQYRLLMESNPHRYEGAYLCGEQSKLLSIKEDNLEKDNKKYVSPDIVLAGNIENTDEKTQYWASEIKMYGNPKWKEDLPKLSHYSKSSLKFQIVLFIFVCENKEQKEEIKGELLKERQELNEYEEIVFFICSKPQDSKDKLIVNQY